MTEGEIFQILTRLMDTEDFYITRGDGERACTITDLLYLAKKLMN